MGNTMSLDRERKLELLREWQLRTEELNRVQKAVRDVLQLRPECPILDEPWHLHNAYTKAVGELVGDKGAWMSWYCWENEMGEKRLKAGAAGGNDMREIVTLEDLLWIIEVDV